MLGPLLAAPAFAQVNYQVVNELRFDPPPPNPRTMALGGAGIGMADDTAAVVLNPATLRLLVRSEVTAGFHYQDAQRQFVTGGSLARPAFGAVPVSAVAAQFGDRGTLDPQRGNPEFAFAYPSKRVSVGAYARYLDIGQLQDLPPLHEAAVPRTTRFTLTEDIASLPVNTTGVEAVAATSISINPSLAIGLGIAAYGIALPFEIAGVERVPPGGQFSSLLETADIFSLSPDTNYAPAYTAGVSWSPASVIHLGAVWHSGTEHSFQQVRSLYGPANVGKPEFVAEQRTITFRTPGSIGVGIGIRATETLRLLADVRRVQYSVLRDGLTALIFEPAEHYRLDDAIELRAGAEYVIPFASVSLALRGGVWRDPPHALTFVGDDPANGALLREVFGGTETTRVHGTGGVGIVVSQVAFDVSVDVARGYRFAGLSGTVRFR
jgi:hypothetical protein